MKQTLEILSICGSLGRGSYNTAVERALPALAPAGMQINAAPWLRDIPLYNFDVQQEAGFPQPIVRKQLADFAAFVHRFETIAA